VFMAGLSAVFMAGLSAWRIQQKRSHHFQNMSNKNTTYANALSRLYGLQKFGIKLGLSKTCSLLKDLGNPHTDQKYIHIGGSNGKGSVAALIASILKQAGLKVGLYSSPHLVRFSERFKINDEEISTEDVISLIEEIFDVISPDEPPTFFEVTTAMALTYFQRQKTDISVIEVGMGGRLDATNIINPLVSIITNISLEHQAFLGPRLLDIAGEKAGIIKPRIDVVSGATQTGVNRLFESICNKKGSPFWRLGKQIRYRTVANGFDYSGLVNHLKGLKISLNGKFQARNCSLAIAATELLEAKGFRISREDILNGVSNTVWPGRMQVAARNPMIIIDGAHNPAGIRAMADSVRAGYDYKHLILVMGIMEDKAIGQILRGIVPYANHVIFTRPDYSRAARPEDLMEQASVYHKPTETSPALPHALKRAIEIANPEDLIIVCGSLFTAGEALNYFDPEKYMKDDFLLTN